MIIFVVAKCSLFAHDCQCLWLKRFAAPLCTSGAIVQRSSRMHYDELSASMALYLCHGLECDRHHRPTALCAANVPLTIIDDKVKARRIASICGISKPPTYKDILTPDQQLVHEAALQACRERVAAKQARKKAGSERVPEIYEEFVSDDSDSEDWDPECDDPKGGDGYDIP